MHTEGITVQKIACFVTIFLFLKDNFHAIPQISQERFESPAVFQRIIEGEFRVIFTVACLEIVWQRRRKDMPSVLYPEVAAQALNHHIVGVRLAIGAVSGDVGRTYIYLI